MMNPKHTFPILTAIFLLTASLACNLFTPERSTPATADSPIPTDTTAPTDAPIPTDALVPTDTATPTDEPAPSGISVSFSGVSFTIPTGLGSGGRPESIAAVDGQGSPGWDVAPAHTKFTLQNYPLQGTMLHPEIYVFPAVEYEKVSAGAAESLKRLRALTSGAGMGIDNQVVPFVPFFNATQTFEARALLMKFQNGTGIRMLTQYDQALIPVNNHELIYHFEGLTSDGSYYIIAVFPINSPILPAEGSPNSIVPAGGVPFNENDPLAYFDAITQNLNNAAPESFIPKLAAMDALIESIKASAP